MVLFVSISFSLVVLACADDLFLIIFLFSWIVFPFYQLKPSYSSHFPNLYYFSCYRYLLLPFLAHHPSSISALSRPVPVLPSSTS